jgi:hypothetical protein
MTPPSAAAAPAVDPRRTIAPRRAPLSVPPQPRRVSGPARRPVRARPGEERRAARSPQEAGLVLGLIEALGRVPRSRLLDRLIQGRVSIAFVAFALIGIVTMQLGLLKLNAGIGRALEHEALLQRENAALSIENSELAAGDRVELQAGRLGMGLTSPGDLHFLTLGSLSFEARRAGAALNAPVASSSTATTAASPAGATTGEGTSGTGASESEAAVGGSGEAGGGTSSATAASSVASAPATSPSGTAGNTSSTSEGASAVASGPSAGAGETSASAPTSGVATQSSSGPSGGAGEAAAVASPAPAGGGATAPSG